ncbi:hypothetical protein B296_00046924 [Ensete ventricosum]|uniref:Uncharacterized protein n=1 Tax=Ensete ventricosum TaxID=4639 RepID=A0A426Z1Y5_ENSVE|nr:hypothetical protein B296_00046924 [Ensete ventricosum]
MGRRFFSPHGEKKSPVGDESCDAGRPSDGSRADNCYLAVPPGSEWSAYRLAGGLVHTTQYGASPPGKANLAYKYGR